MRVDRTCVRHSNRTHVRCQGTARVARDPLHSRSVELALARRTLPLDGPPRVMGILNVTDDSFYVRAGADPAAAVERGLALAAAGADLIDVGGMTAQPGASLSEDEEAARVVPVIRELRGRTD